MALIGMLAVTLFTFVVMNLWNWLVPAIFGWQSVNFWQALGLLLLSRILFGGFRGGPRPSHASGRRGRLDRCGQWRRGAGRNLAKARAAVAIGACGCPLRRRVPITRDVSVDRHRRNMHAKQNPAQQQQAKRLPEVNRLPPKIAGTSQFHRFITTK